MFRFILFFVAPSRSGLGEAGKITRVILAVLFLSAALLLLQMLNTPFGPYPLFYIKTESYLLLLFIYITGTTLPLIWITFAHIEETPLAPGSRLAKALNTVFIFYLSWGVSVTVSRGIQYLVQQVTRADLNPFFNVFELVYFIYLLNSASTGVFNLKLGRAMLSAIPCILSYLLLPFEITLIRSLSSGASKNVFIRVSGLGYALLVILALLPLALVVVSQTRGRSTESIKRSEKFKKATETSGVKPDLLYQQALTYLSMNKIKQALKLLNTVIESGNFKPDALLERGKLLWDLKNPEQAAADIEAYLDIKKRSISMEPYLKLMDCYRTLSEWDNVVDVANEFLTKFQTNMQGWYYKAEAYKSSGEIHAAADTLKEMLEHWNDVPRYRQAAEKEWLEKGKKLLAEITE